MKLLQIYLLVTFLAIGCLAANTFWQYQQFVNNYQKISTSLPQNIADNLPNSDDFDKQLNNILSQTQPKMDAATTSKEFEYDDGNIKLNFSSDWQKLNLANEENKPGNNEILLFAAYKTITATNPIPSYLTIKKSNLKDAAEIIAKCKKDLEADNLASDLTQSQVDATGGDILTVLEARYKTAIPAAEQTIDLPVKIAIGESGNGYYLISITGTDNNEMDSIIKSIQLLPNNNNDAQTDEKK